MADKIKIEHLYLHIGDEYNGPESRPEEDDGEDLAEFLCDLMCGGCEDDDDDHYSDEEIEELVEGLSEEFGFSKKKAKCVADFVFNWAEDH